MPFVLKTKSFHTSFLTVRKTKPITPFVWIFIQGIHFKRKKPRAKWDLIRIFFCVLEHPSKCSPRTGTTTKMQTHDLWTSAILLFFPPWSPKSSITQRPTTSRRDSDSRGFRCSQLTARFCSGGFCTTMLSIIMSRPLHKTIQDKRLGEKTLFTAFTGPHF